MNAIPGVGGVKVYRAWNSNLSPAELMPPEEVGEWLDGLTGVPPNILTWLQVVYHAGKTADFDRLAEPSSW